MDLIFMKFPKLSAQFWRVFIVSFVVGASSGALGTAVVWSSLLAYRGNLVSGSMPVFADRKALSARENEIIRKLEDEISLSLADIYLEKTDPNARYGAADALGRAVVLTTDGWLISHKTVFDPKRKASVLVGSGSALLPIEQLLEDVETGIIFIKIKADNLRPAIFGKSADERSGNSVYEIAGAHNLKVNRIEQLRSRFERISSSDLLESRLILAESAPLSFAGAPVVNESGEVLAILVRENSEISAAVPMEQIAPLFSPFLSEKKLTRPSLGVHGFHLSLTRVKSGERQRGFLVFADARGAVKAVERNSAAERAGLLAGDIITKVGSSLVNGTAELSEILLAQRADQDVDLTVVRNGLETIIPVKLGTRDSGKKY